VQISILVLAAESGVTCCQLCAYAYTFGSQMVIMMLMVIAILKLIVMVTVFRLKAISYIDWPHSWQGQNFDTHKALNCPKILPCQYSIGPKMQMGMLFLPNYSYF
jgi:hypothetical protein